MSNVNSPKAYRSDRSDRSDRVFLFFLFLLFFLFFLFFLPPPQQIAQKKRRTRVLLSLLG